MPADLMLPWIIPDSCEGCADCVSACRRGCLAMHATAFEGVFVPWLDDVDACSGCGRCELACPWGAISMTAYLEDARRRFVERRPGPGQPPAGVAGVSIEESFSRTTGIRDID